jgi:hypothetical protein
MTVIRTTQIHNIILSILSLVSILVLTPNKLLIWIYVDIQSSAYSRW